MRGAPLRDPESLLGRLADAASDLRAEVAAAITRRRAPSFTFRVAAFDGPDGPG